MDGSVDARADPRRAVPSGVPTRRSTSISSASPPARSIRVAVPVHFENEGLSPGLKRGGVLNVIRHAVEVYCDPDTYPGAVYRRPVRPRLQRQRALARPEGHRGRRTPVITERDFVVATVAPPTKMTEVTAETPRCRGGGGRLSRRRRRRRRSGKAPAGKERRRQGRRPRQGQAGLIPAALVVMLLWVGPRQSGAGHGPEPAQHRLHGAST